MRAYTSRPGNRGKAQKAWDRFKKEFNGEEPKEIYYTPRYDHEFRGWVCEWDIKDPLIKWLNYSATKCHTFYHSSEL